ncbi:uncharacterized protein LOC114580118 [Dendrobium catenatum]|uniref:uncharacterized protein LOC114580118 n=1 Tax=Dendrobium catenatum TaxID=906689 RepID=UPI0010A0128E|nr:uncharacterized protein LOC114580118 [Dendrobium catenatum]
MIGSNWDYFYVPSTGLSGGIILLWNSDTTLFKVEDSSSQMVIRDLKVINNEKWKVAIIYGSMEVPKRMELWNMLGKYSNSDLPMAIGGDFNFLLSKEEKLGGRRFIYSQGSREMEECLLNNDLHEIGYIGPKFTWCNNKVGSSRMLERLDRCFVNTIALSSPIQLIERHLARIASDHCPILLQFKNFNTNPRKMIKYENCWASYQASFGIVRKEWGKNYQGSFSQVLNKKFKRSLKSLFFWSKAKHKELNSLKDVLIQEITDIKGKETSLGSLSEQEKWNLKAKVRELNATMARLNMWWKQRAKVKWLCEGDGNSKFFHSYASARRNANKIIKVKDEDGMVVEEQSQIEDGKIKPL